MLSSSDPNNSTADTSDHNHTTCTTSMNGGHKDVLPSTIGTQISNGSSTAADTGTTVVNRIVPNQSLKSKTHYHHLFRFVCFDIPFIIVFAIYLSIHHLHWLSYNYLVPLNTLQYFDTHERDITYYHRICTVEDQTTNDTQDLFVDIRSSSSSSNSSNYSNNDTRKNTKAKIDIAVHQMLRHGVTIIPNLISESTATKLRHYILEQNKISDHLIFVIENQFRWSFPIQVDQDPIIIQALQEILGPKHNPNLLPYLEAIMGTNPAVIEFTAITQAYGAKEQFWHQDGMLFYFFFVERQT